MNPRFLLDTQIVIRWVAEPKKLSRDQRRIVERAVLQWEPLALSAMSLLEIAALEESRRIDANVRDIFEFLDSSPMFSILPITVEIASEVLALKALRDPADRAIVATARVHRLKLLTSDQAIIASGLVPVIE